ncbi:hypothetical protein [Natranaeroarchaeum aerophilus]|uniref:Uncharacterized protein n=1 Tax=Natranaeroarchaeum aerophilus TaxID=2917711 RepID=A0AAE3FPX6_9EURY|nr:hypothetical protein [Natranaeroarchaeum aerophilus]MCL9812479.1 hypothetical protein [Natranaeroarchaeum aerophilus]
MSLIDSLARGIDALRRPEFTGENRCDACTVVNAAIVAVVGLVLYKVRKPLGYLAVAVGSALVYLRGYVVPGTPSFAPELVRPLPIDFDHDEPEGVGSGSLTGSDEDAEPSEFDGEEIIEALARAEVVEAGEEQLYLNESFRENWEARIEELGELEPDALADRTAVASPHDVEGEVHGNRILLKGAGRDVWLSHPIAIAEAAATETLANWDVDAEMRAAAAEPLRTFIELCPACGGDVRETTLRQCCGGPGSYQSRPGQLVLACEDCDTVLFEFDDVAV